MFLESGVVLPHLVHSSCSFSIGSATADVVLIGSNVSLSFDDVEANFGKKEIRFRFEEVRVFGSLCTRKFSDAK